MGSKKQKRFLIRTKRLLAERVAYMCSRPLCRRLTIKPDASNSSKSTRIGEAGHIYGVSAGRRDDTKIDSFIRSHENGIWLCESCHTIVDCEESIYSVDTLIKWKTETESYVQELVMQDTRLRQLRIVCQNYLSALRFLSALPQKLDHTFDSPNGNGINLTRLFMELELVLFDNQFLEEAELVSLIVQDLDKIVCPFVHNNKTGNQLNISCWKNMAVKILMIDIMRFSLASYQRYFAQENSMVQNELERLLQIEIVPFALDSSKTQIR